MASIYHYTSGSSLVGIISNREFWATDINFLNDHKEHIFGYEAALIFIKDLSVNESDPVFGGWLRKLYEQVIIYLERNVRLRQIYIISFSKTPDSIAHWFSYCEKNQGYCIEFEENAFFDEKDLMSREKFATRFEDVIYGDVESFSHKLSEVISKGSIISMFSAVRRTAEMSGINIDAEDSPQIDVFHENLANQLMHNIFEKLIFSSSAYKEQGFAHEDEKRLVLFQKRISPKIREEFPEVRFREKNSVIFPYIPILFNRQSIKKIIIGPCPDYALKKSGLLKLLKYYNVECEIEHSSSSLRFT